ncbi:hypothetical protein B9Z55_020353 [Caenorhabditis nigoni]|uniref:Uncharacterized protein n=1 Tax=Caenorhabditis nigoni TaxID=1611254 RepID=A0A2G5TMD9_9PELO|nr:hypothetical protein B9Z55_020353 [Caenorhabditis nigoni]
MLIELFLLCTIFVSMIVGCKKKNEASKLKPRNLDKGGAGTPVAGNTPNKQPAIEPAAASKQVDPDPGNQEKMAERPADDNETINDAKSNWGTVV